MSEIEGMFGGEGISCGSMGGNGAKKVVEAAFLISLKEWVQTRYCCRFCNKRYSSGTASLFSSHGTAVVVEPAKDVA